MTTPTSQNSREDRYAFGDNWRLFLDQLTPARIDEAKKSLVGMLGLTSLGGLSFLDVGSGSGIFSLAARDLGARVFSFDFDPQSVACTRTLRERYFPADPAWAVQEGDALDPDFMRPLGTFDVVYSWGVLHHTGNQWKALDHAARAVSPGGLLYLALYNDQGWPSRVWRTVKLAYNRLPKGLRFLVVGPALLRLWGPTMVKDLLRGNPLRSWRGYQSNRGMDAWHDLLDWVGGYPFEVSRPDEVVAFLAARGFTAVHVKSCGGGLGCNEFLFRSPAGDSP